MKIKLMLLLAMLTTVSVFAQKQNDSYQFTVDMTKLKNDQLEISLITPKITTAEVTYHLPKIVPGTYADYDYGRYASNFKAFDQKGKELSVEKTDANSYKIKNATKLCRITYLTDDSWDSPEIKGTFIFEPAGTEYDENKCFAINTHCIIGYFDDMKRKTYEVTFVKPQGFYGATSMTASKSDDKKDVFVMPNYMTLVDAPIMYNKPDTTVLKVGGADLLISVYSPNKQANSAEIAAKVKNLLEAQKEYLGGTLPIKKYAFIIYLAEKLHGVSYGALEHSYSSFYYLPEASSEELSQTVKDVCAHEFFHIVTPLSIHSEEIGDFDFDKPKMSKHLWMYEGLTEYAAGHMQMKYGLIKLPQYLEMIQRKIASSKNTYKDDLPFTEMSAKVLDKDYKDQYANVYEKGALIGLCLDIKLRQLSNGKYGTQDLMRDLAKYYGKEKSFRDIELFDKITELTGFPQIREFFTKYVEGKEPLPLTETLESVGIKYEAPQKTKGINMGFAFSNLNQNPETSRIFLMKDGGINDFGKKLGFKANDELVSVNGNSLAAESFRDSYGKFIQTAKEGDNLEVVVMRKNETTDKFEEVKLSATLFPVESEQSFKVKSLLELTPAQQQLQDYWLKPVTK